MNSSHCYGFLRHRGFVLATIWLFWASTAAADIEVQLRYPVIQPSYFDTVEGFFKESPQHGYGVDVPDLSYAVEISMPRDRPATIEVIGTRVVQSQKYELPAERGDAKPTYLKLNFSRPLLREIARKPFSEAEEAMTIRVIVGNKVAQEQRLTLLFREYAFRVVQEEPIMPLVELHVDRATRVSRFALSPLGEIDDKYRFMNSHTVGVRCLGTYYLRRAEFSGDGDRLRGSSGTDDFDPARLRSAPRNKPSFERGVALLKISAGSNSWIAAAVRFGFSVEAINFTCYGVAGVRTGTPYLLHINEGDPAIEQLLQKAVDQGLVSKFEGYASGERGVVDQVFAIFSVLAKRGWRHEETDWYREIAPERHEHMGGFASFQVFNSRVVRSIDEIWSSGASTCVDGATLFASVLTRIGIHVQFVCVAPQEEGASGHVIIRFAADAAKKNWIPLTLSGLPGDSRTLSREGLVKAFRLCASDGADWWQTYLNAPDKGALFEIPADRKKIWGI